MNFFNEKFMPLNNAHIDSGRLVHWGYDKAKLVEQMDRHILAVLASNSLENCEVFETSTKIATSELSDGSEVEYPCIVVPDNCIAMCIESHKTGSFWYIVKPTLNGGVTMYGKEVKVTIDLDGKERFEFEF